MNNFIAASLIYLFPVNLQEAAMKQLTSHSSIQSDIIIVNHLIPLTLEQLSNKSVFSPGLHVFRFGEESFKRLHRKHLTSHSNMTIIKYMALEPLKHFAHLISCHMRFFLYFCLVLETNLQEAARKHLTSYSTTLTMRYRAYDPPDLYLQLNSYQINHFLLFWLMKMQKYTQNLVMKMTNFCLNSWDLSPCQISASPSP